MSAGGDEAKASNIVRGVSWRFWVGLAALVIVALVLRGYRVGQESYWLDEMHSLANSSASRTAFESMPRGVIVQSMPRTTEIPHDVSIVDVWRSMAVDSHPPLYFSLLHGWRRWFGDSEAAVRWLSVLASALTLIPVACMVREVAGSRTAFIAAALLALSDLSIRTGQDARPYALAMLFSSLIALFSCRLFISENQPRRASAVGLATSVLLGLLTHYFVGLVALGVGVLALTRLRTNGARKALLALAAGGLAAGIVWGPLLLQQWPFIASQRWLDADSSEIVRLTLMRVTDLPLRCMASLPAFKHEWSWSIVGIGLLGTSWYSTRKSKMTPLLLAWILAPVAVLGLIDVSLSRQLLNHSRYFAIVVPAIGTLFAFGIDSIRSQVRWVVFAATVGFLFYTGDQPAVRHPVSRLAAIEIGARLTPSDLLVFDTTQWPESWMDHLFQPIRYYLTLDSYNVVLIDREPTDSLVSEMQKFNRVLVVSPRFDDFPNPCPKSHVMIAQSPYYFHVGWVYIFQSDGFSTGDPALTPN